MKNQYEYTINSTEDIYRALDEAEVRTNNDSEVVQDVEIPDTSSN